QGLALSRLNATRQVTEMPSFRCDGDHTTAKNPNANSCSSVQSLQRTPAELSVRQMLRLRHTLSSANMSEMPSNVKVYCLFESCGFEGWSDSCFCDLESCSSWASSFSREAAA